MKIRGKTFFRNLFFLVLLILFCGLISFAIVWPIWKFSQSFKILYTIVGIALISSFLIYLMILYFKKKGLINSIKLLLNLFLIFTAFIISTFFIISAKRLIGIIVFIVIIILTIILNFIWKKFVNEK